MPRPALGPRLYLDTSRGQWVIRDGTKFRRTGAAASDREAAKAAFARHMKRTQARRTIYFITCLEENFPIKIGRTTDLTQRIKDLCTALPFQPVLLASFNGRPSDEPDLHKRFADLRLQGEWFRRAPALMDYIAGLRKFEILPELRIPEFPVERALAMAQ